MSNRYNEGDKVKLARCSPRYSDLPGMQGTVVAVTHSVQKQQYRYAVIFPIPWTEGREEIWATLSEDEIVESNR